MKKSLALFALLLVPVATPSSAQSAVKCVDAQGKVTYSNVACDKQGLKDAGPIADRTTTVFAPPGEAAKADRAAKKNEGKQADAKRDAAEDRPGPGIRPANPIAEKLAK
jgi:hypothetical protein